MPRNTDDSFTLVHSGESAELRGYLANRDTTIHLTPAGAGSKSRFEIHQVTPKLHGNRFTAYLGDTLRFDGALLTVERARVLPAAKPAPVQEPEGLFEVDPSQVRADPHDGLSADRRRTLRQAETLEAGRHPLTGERLHEQAPPVEDRAAAGRRCGNCWFRTRMPYRGASYVKCAFPGRLGADEIEATAPPRVTHGAGSDLRDWWPACPDHVYGEPQLSQDAARFVPDGGEKAGRR